MTLFLSFYVKIRGFLYLLKTFYFLHVQENIVFTPRSFKLDLQNGKEFLLPFCVKYKTKASSILQICLYSSLICCINSKNALVGYLLSTNL